MTDQLVALDRAIDIIGNGVGKQNQERIFNEFFSTKHEQGSVLGLLINCTIIASYGGSITLCRQEGCSSKFNTTLPSDLPGAAKLSSEAVTGGPPSVT